MSTTPPFVSTELSVVRRNGWILALAASPILLVIARLFFDTPVHHPFFGFVFQGLALAPLALVYVVRRNPWPRVEKLPVEADAGGVKLGAKRVPRAALRAGFVLPGGQPRVLLQRKLGLPIELQVSSTEQGRGLLRALGFDASQTVARFRVASRLVSRRSYMATMMGVTFAVYGGFIGFMTGRHHDHVSPVFGALLSVVLALVFAFFLVPTWLSIGADGVVLSWFRSKRFIGYGEIARVEPYRKSWGRAQYVGVTLVLRSGEEVPIPTGKARWDEQSNLIKERLREAMEAFKEGGTAADAAMLQRGSRAVADWVTALRAIGAGANADMRTAPLPPERLFRIVEDPTCTAPERAAAAVALGTDLDDEARARLRSAAAAVAAPRLRVAIEAAAGSSAEAELEAALTELEEHEPKARAQA